MFKLGMNVSDISQSFVNLNGDYASVEPMGVFDFTGVKAMPSYFERISNFLGEMKKREQKRFYIQRTYALGDTLMGVPAVRYCRELGWDAVLRVDGYNSRLMSILDVPHLVTNQRLDIPGLIMDGVLERDHTDPQLGRLHRTHIYFKALGVNDLPKQVDWSCDLSKLPPCPFNTPTQFVVMVGQGANYRKQLHRETIELIINRLNAEGRRVFYNGDPDDLQISSDMNVQLRRSLNVSELFSLISRADCLVTVDSGPLWIGHFTQTPTVAILGPSHPDQRLILHPLYPEGAVGIKMNDWIKCESCTENGCRCNNTMRCLHTNGDRLAETVANEVSKFYEERS